MVWPHSRDVILYARSGYYYDNMFIICLFSDILSNFKTCLVFNPEKLQEHLPYKVMFLDVTSSCFTSLVPCLKFTLCNVVAKTGNLR